MSDAVKVVQDGAIVEMILNRPDNRNAMNVELMDGISHAVDLIEKLQTVRVVILPEGKARVFLLD